MLAPLTNTQSNPDGTLTDDEITWLLARARGGFGLVMTAAAYVNRAGNAWPGQLGVCDDAHDAGLRRLADGIREAGAVSSVQLHHGGYRANPDASGLPRVAPFDDEETGARALTTDEVHRTVDEFVSAAVRVERAGFDGVEIHGAHGYLLGQFLETRNLREDGYGGDADGRARIIWEIIDGVRSATKADFQLGLRLSVERFGLDPAEMLDLTTRVLAAGTVDYLDLSLWDIPAHVETFADLPRHGTALGAAGKVLDGPAATAALAAGLDFVAVGRAAVADQSFAEQTLRDPSYPGPHFPVTRDHLRSQAVGEAFVDYFSTGWPHLVSDH